MMFAGFCGAKVSLSLIGARYTHFASGMDDLGSLRFRIPVEIRRALAQGAREGEVWCQQEVGATVRLLRDRRWMLGRMRG